MNQMNGCKEKEKKKKNSRAMNRMQTYMRRFRMAIWKVCAFDAGANRGAERRNSAIESRAGSRKQRRKKLQEKRSWKKDLGQRGGLPSACYFCQDRVVVMRRVRGLREADGRKGRGMIDAPVASVDV